MIQRISAVAVLFSCLGFAQAPPAAPQPRPPAPAAQPAPAAPVVEANLTNVSLTQVIDMLARQLHLNIVLDPSVKGSVTINTYGQTRNLDARNLLDMILRINGFGMAQEGDIYHIVPMKDMLREPLPINQVSGEKIPEDDQIMLNLVFLKYVTVDELSKILNEFTSENAQMLSYAPANLLFILDTRRNMRRTMELINLFDSDTFANMRVRLFELKNARPSDVQQDLENILKSISLDAKTSTVRFLAVDRISTLIAVAPNPGVFDTVAEWIKKLDVPAKVTSGDVEIHVYHVKYGRADCLATSLGSLFGTSTGSYGYSGVPAAGYGGGYGSPYGATPYAGGYGGAYGGGYGGGYGGAYGGGYGSSAYGMGGTGAYGSPNSFATGFGGAGACGGSVGYGGGGYGYPSFGGYAAQAPATTPAAAGQAGAASNATTAAAAAAEARENRPRIVPNLLDNSLLIQADAERYQSILKVLKDLDVPPRQILLEAKIYEVDLSDALSSGVQYMLQQVSGNTRKLMGTLASGTATFNVGTLVDNSRELMAALSLNENASHVQLMSEPSLIATDSIPAVINVGTQVPVATGSTTIPTSGGVAVSQSIAAENTGVTLQVNARVTPSGVVTLIVNQEISGINNSVSTSTSSPAFNQQVVQTQITLMDGDTIAIGGTIQDNVTDSTNGIPFLSKIPVMGGLFGSKVHSHSRSELIIFMTPHVIQDETGLIDASDELVQRVKLLKKMVKGL